MGSTYALLEDKNAKNKLALEIHHTEKGVINSLEDLHSLPYGELLIVKAKSHAVCWGYFKERRLCRLVRIHPITHDCNVPNRRSRSYENETERDFHYFSNQPELYRTIPLEIRQSPAKLKEFSERVWRRVNKKLNDLNNNEEIMDLTLDEEEELHSDKEEKMQMEEKLGLDLSDSEEEEEKAESEVEETEEESRMTKMMTEFMDDVELSDEESEEHEDDEKMKPARKSAKRKKMELIGQLENALHKSVKIIEPNIRKLERELKETKKKVLERKREIALEGLDEEQKKQFCPYCLNYIPGSQKQLMITATTCTLYKST